MKNLKFGIKLGSNQTHLLQEVDSLIKNKVFSYVEILLNPNSLTIQPFQEYEVPYVIHVPHENFGVNIGEESRKEYTFEMIEESIRWADALDASIIILHAGTGSAKAAQLALSQIRDKRVILENMTVKGIFGEDCLGYSAESISELMSIGGFGLCLDLGHAIKASISLERNYRELIQEFVELEPKIFHISDGALDKETDEHLNIGEGVYDFRFIKDIIVKSSTRNITLETPRCNKNSLADDIRNLRRLRELFS